VGNEGDFLVAICRGHTSRVILVWTESCDFTDPLIAETKAALLVFKKMKEAGFKNIIF
jgi:hypothetical protein